MEDHEGRSSRVGITVMPRWKGVIIKISVAGNDNGTNGILRFMQRLVESGVLRRRIVRGRRRPLTVKSFQLQGLRVYFQRRVHV